MHSLIVMWGRAVRERQFDTRKHDVHRLLEAGCILVTPIRDSRKHNAHSWQNTFSTLQFSRRAVRALLELLVYREDITYSQFEKLAPA